jgi:hypothetical protein
MPHSAESRVDFKKAPAHKYRDYEISRVVDPNLSNPEPDPALFLNPDPDTQNSLIQIQCGSGSAEENLKTVCF